MASLDWHATSHETVTLVELLVTSDAPERVRVENCLDGPVWPPRRQGVPAEGWSEEGFEGRVGPDDRLVLGYASPAAPADPPARIASVESVTATDEEPREMTAHDVVRTLGDPAPPREAVPTPDTKDRENPGPDGDVPTDDPADDTDRSSHTRSTARDSPDCGELPPAVESYLGEVAARLEDAERLGKPATAGEASDALAAVGGPDQAGAIQAQLRADREALADLIAQCERLAARIDAVDVPVETLARLA